MDEAVMLSNGMFEVNMDKIRVFFFFAADRKALNKFLKQ